jgi:hypothetical protein
MEIPRDVFRNRTQALHQCQVRASGGGYYRGREWKLVSKTILCLSPSILFGSDGKEIRYGIFTSLRSPGIDSTSLCSQAGRYDNPIPSRFLAPIDCSKIPAQSCNRVFVPAGTTNRFLALIDVLKFQYRR